jgi:hypothetical protein
MARCGTLFRLLKDLATSKQGGIQLSVGKQEIRLALSAQVKWSWNQPGRSALSRTTLGREGPQWNAEGRLAQ